MYTYLLFEFVVIIISLTAGIKKGFGITFDKATEHQRTV